MSKVSCVAAGKCRRRDFANGARGTQVYVSSGVLRMCRPARGKEECQRGRMDTREPLRAETHPKTGK